MRRLQWRFCSVPFSNRGLPRFPKLPSKRWPPKQSVPRHIQALSDTLLSRVGRFLRNHPTCHHPDNLTIDERDELSRLSRSQDLVIRPADKGGRWVIMPTSAYIAEGRRQLSNASFYKPIACSRSRFVYQRIISALNLLRSRKFLTRSEYDSLVPPPSCQEGRFYLLPKVHKTSWPSPSMPPGRPIVANTRAVFRNCSNLIEHFLAPIAQSLDSYVRDSLHVIAILREFQVTQRSILFCCDVESLYTNVPTSEGLQCVSEAFLRHPNTRRPDLTILTLLKLFLSSNEFVFDDQLWLQLNGVSMGSVFGGSYANIFLGSWEETAFSSFTMRPSLWLRYQDDVFGVWEHGLDTLLLLRDHLNSINSSIRISMDYSSHSVRFLDLEIFKTKDQALLSYRTGFKPTDSHRILSPDSEHPHHVFRSIVFSQLLRWATHSSSKEGFEYAYHRVTPTWLSQGYSRSCLRAAKKRVTSFLNFSEGWLPGFYPCVPASCPVCPHAVKRLAVADFVTSNSYPVVQHVTCRSVGVIYVIQCSSCNKRYVGETGQSLGSRIREHLNDVAQDRNTSVAKHFSIGNRCTVQHFSFFGVDIATNSNKRKLKEKVWIKRLNSLTPQGLNIVSSSVDATMNLVLPFSSCASKVNDMCRNLCGNSIKVRAAYMRGKTIREIFNS